MKRSWTRRTPRRWRPSSLPWTSIEANDERTLVLGMAHPYYEVINVVKTGFWAIANIETRKKLAEQYGQSGVDGTGPFLFEEWVPGSHVTVTRWDDYPGSIVPYFSNKGKAYLDGIRWEAILEAAQRAVRIENAEIDTLRTRRCRTWRAYRRTPTSRSRTSASPPATS